MDGSSAHAINSNDPFLRVRTQDAMEEVEWTDDIGRQFVVFVKKGGDPSRGIIKGPQPLDSLGLDQDTNVRLHNELKARGIITHQDAMRRPQMVLQAIQRALRVNVQRVQNAYLGIEQPNTEPQPQSQPTVERVQPEPASTDTTPPLPPEPLPKRVAQNTPQNAGPSNTKEGVTDAR